jgi:hypothetical protein
MTLPALRAPEVLVSLVAGAWTLVHFLHQHSLERNRFFFELFREFNRRYDALNDPLGEIMEHRNALSQSERATAVDYFNLCAEEYMSYRLGYLHHVVWASWSAGMRFYANDPRIRSLWQQEKASNSYYGFDLEAV